LLASEENDARPELVTEEKGEVVTERVCGGVSAAEREGLGLDEGQVVTVAPPLNVSIEETIADAVPEIVESLLAIALEDGELSTLVEEEAEFVFVAQPEWLAL